MECGQPDCVALELPVRKASCVEMAAELAVASFVSEWSIDLADCRDENLRGLIVWIKALRDHVLDIQRVREGKRGPKALQALSVTGIKRTIHLRRVVRVID